MKTLTPEELEKLTTKELNAALDAVRAAFHAMKAPTPEELNAAHAAYFQLKCEQFRRLGEKYPHELHEAANLATRLIRAGLVDNPDFLGETSLEAAMEKVERMRGLDQSIRASKPRTKKATVRRLTIDAMRKARNEGQTLKQFLLSAENESVQGVYIEGVKREDIKPEDQDGLELSKQRYSVWVEKLDDSKEVMYSALETWWKEAGEAPNPRFTG